MCVCVCVCVCVSQSLAPLQPLVSEKQRGKPIDVRKAAKRDVLACTRALALINERIAAESRVPRSTLAYLPTASPHTTPMFHDLTRRDINSLLPPAQRAKVQTPASERAAQRARTQAQRARGHDDGEGDPKYRRARSALCARRTRRRRDRD